MSSHRPRVLVVYRGEVAMFGLHLIAYMRAFPDAEYSLLPYGEEERGGMVIRDICAELDISVVDVRAARATSFDAIAVHSYVDRDVVAKLLAQIDHREVWFYSDMLRNGFVFPSGQDLSRSTLIYFGFVLDDVAIPHELPAAAREVRVVPLDFITSMWRLVGERVKTSLEALPRMDEETLLIALRYWGNLSLYQTRRPETALDAITDLVIPATVKHVVVKHDPRSLLSAQDVIEELQRRLGNRIEVTAWDDKPEVREAIGSLDVLDLYISHGDWLNGHFFGFDGTPNILVGALQSRATVHWLSSGRLGSYFFEPHVVGLVREGVAWQQEIIDQFKRGNTTKLRASYDGSHFSSLFEGSLGLTEALGFGYISAIVDHIAATVGMAPNPDLKELVIRVDGLKRDRLYFDRLAQAQRGDPSRLLAEVEAAAAARETQHLAEAVAAAAVRETQHLAEAAAAAAARETEHLAEAEARYAALAGEAETRYVALEAKHLELEEEHHEVETTLAQIKGSLSWRMLTPLRTLKQGFGRSARRD